MHLNRVLICGEFSRGRLEESYVHAFGDLGCKVDTWSCSAAQRRFIPGAALGSWIARRVDIAPWIAKPNRELLLHVGRTRPNLILLTGRTLVSAGAIAQIKASWPDIGIILLWPDSLLQLNQSVQSVLPMIDAVASFCRAFSPALARFGARETIWLPFAADSRMIAPSSPAPEATKDIVFIGNHKPERETTMLRLLDAGLSVSVWGPPDWRKFARNRSRVSEYWTGRMVDGAGYMEAARSGRIMINPIDPTTFPGTNMRFFEALACGIPLVCSSGFELQDDALRAEVCIVYDGSDEDLIQKVKAAKSGSQNAQVERGSKWVTSLHTYHLRCQQLAAWYENWRQNASFR